MPLQLLIGLLLSALIGLLGNWRGSLSRSGVLGAVLVGGAVFGFGGLAWGVLLIAFFVSSSLLSKFKAGHKAALAEKFSKGSRRDLGQALANGALAAALAGAHSVQPHPALLAAFVGAMAAVNADTWATELGVLARGLPRLITTGRRVDVGTSGAISPAGTAAALGGAAFIGVIAGLMAPWLGLSASGGWKLLAIATAAGLSGSLADSLLGATLQSIYYCDQCGKETERHPRHRCGQATRPRRGWRWLNNDWVNFICSLAGALLAAGLADLTGLGDR